MDFEITKEILTWIVTFGGAMGVIYKWLIKPINDFIVEQKHTNKLQNRALIDLLQHTAYGNHVDTLIEDLELLKDEVYK